MGVTSVFWIDLPLTLRLLVLYSEELALLAKMTSCRPRNLTSKPGETPNSVSLMGPLIKVGPIVLEL